MRSSVFWSAFQILLYFSFTLIYCAVFYSFDAGLFQYHLGVKQFGPRSMSGLIWVSPGKFIENLKHLSYSINTGQPRYLKVQGNGRITSTYTKFDISKMWRHPNILYMFNFSKTYFCSTHVVKLFLLKTGLK